MTTARVLLKEQIQQDHPTWVVQAFPWVPRQVAKGAPAVSVWRADLEPAPGSQGLELRHNITVNLYAPRTADDAAEQELEDLLDDLLLSLQRTDSVRWTKAERMVFDKVISGWQIQGYLRSPDIYRQTVITERGPNAA